MNLFLCEKPSQAKDLAAAALGRPVLRQSHLECDAGIVTWASGHLLELPMPDGIDPRYKRWNKIDLPIIPQEFVWRPKDGRAEEQLNAIGALLSKSDNVILSTDAEREGELIGRNILNYHNYSGPMQRLWLKGLDPASIQHALGNLLPGSEKDSLFDSALTRAKSDWLVGMNASRAASIQIGRPGQPIPIGRVQTPTLALIVDRDNEISDFKETTYLDFEIEVTSETGTVQVLKLQQKEGDAKLQMEGAKHIQKKCAWPAQLEVLSETVATPPPKLFNLSGLQEKTNEIWGWTAAYTLKVAQRLYEHHKILSYPRSDSTVLPAEQEALIPKTLACVGTTALRSKLPSAPVIRNTTFVAEIETAHHAIIPTTLKPNIAALTDDERKAYLLVAKTYVAALYPDHIATKITNSVIIDGHQFVASGSETVAPGWRAISTLPDTPLPAFKENAEIGITHVYACQTSTEPPRPYTDGTLIADMTHIRKFVTNPAHLAVLKENSALGTEATRASVIEGLVDSGMITRNGVNLESSEKARKIIGSLKEYAPRLVDPAETAIWEDGLQRIEKNTLTVDQFLAGIEKRVHSYTRALLSIPKPAAEEQDMTAGYETKVKCPKSGTPVRDNGRNWLFPGFPRVFCPKILAKREMSAEIYADMFAGKEMEPLEGFVSKVGKPFSAGVRYDETAGTIGFDFPPRGGNLPGRGSFQPDRDGRGGMRE